MCVYIKVLQSGPTKEFRIIPTPIITTIITPPITTIITAPLIITAPIIGVHNVRTNAEPPPRRWRQSLVQYHMIMYHQ